jgi:TadE-like protein
MRIRKRARNNSGQALIETALVLPLLLIVVLNAVNFGFFFLVALNLTASPRSGVEYAMLGFATPSPLTQSEALPGPATKNTSVGYQTYSDMQGALGGYTNAHIQICSQVLGVTATTPPLAKCVTCSSASDSCSCTDKSCTGAAGNPAPDADPESPTFTLQQVRVTYTFSPPIPPAIFNLVLLAAPVCSAPGGGNVTCSFTRLADMRAMN